jgi:predicted nucleotidyltransferase
METIVSSIIEELNLDDDRITNIFNYGSWVYGTNHEKSDRDFLIIMKNSERDRQKRLKFHKDFDYFHSFQLHRLKNYDITIHSCENFELLLEKNYMLAVECIFYPDEFILRNKIN